MLLIHSTYNILLTKGFLLLLKFFILLPIIILIGCNHIPEVKKETKIDQITEKENWVKLIEGSDLTRDTTYNENQYNYKLNNGTLLNIKDWNDFNKKYIMSFNIEYRDTILRALSQYRTSYDKVDKLIKLKPTFTYYNKTYSKSYVSVVADLTKTSANASLVFKYYGKHWIFANKLTVVADDYKWISSKLNFHRDNYSSNIWEYTTLDLNNPKYRAIANKIVSSKEVIIRFHGTQYYDDIEVTKKMKDDLSLFLRAFDLINKH